MRFDAVWLRLMRKENEWGARRLTVSPPYRCPNL